MAASQKEISVSEFFAKNRHLLGFDNPRKALLTTVKEAVDNALDACEEAGILPEIWVHIERVGEDRFKVGVQDNGPGHPPPANPLDFRQAPVRLEVPPHADEPRPAGHRHQRRRHVRPADDRQAGEDHVEGLQALRRALLRVADRHQAQPPGDPQRQGRRRGHRAQRQGPPRHRKARHRMDRNRSRHAGDDRTGGPLPARPRQRRRLPGADGHGQSPRDAALRRSRRQALGPPAGDRRAAAGAAEIKPHPYGVELGRLVGMLKETKAPTVGQFLIQSFSRVSPAVARKICEAAKIGVRSSPAEVRPAGGRRHLPGDPADEDPRPGDRLHRAHRRGADPQGPAPVAAGRVLCRGHAAAGRLSRQPVPDRGRPGLRRHVGRPADLARGPAGNARRQRRPHLAAVPLLVVRRHRGRRGRQDHRRGRHAAAGLARQARSPRRSPSCTRRCGT